MNTNKNTLKLLFTTLLAHAMCFTVVLSHIHAKDTVSLMSQSSAVNKLAGSDITAKALGDLHHHVDKASLKNIHAVTGPTAARRARSLNPLEIDHNDDSLSAQFHNFLLRLRVVASLCIQTV